MAGAMARRSSQVRRSVLVVEDDPLVRELLEARLTTAGWAVQSVALGLEAEQVARERAFDLVLLDYQLPDIDGPAVLRQLKKTHPGLPVIMLTAHATVDRAVDTMSLGARYFLSKPVDFDLLMTQMERAVAEARAVDAGPGAEPAASETPTGMNAIDDPLLARSGSMLELKSLLGKVGRTPVSTVLLTGESGVGKDCAARFLHRASDRAEKPFVNITCSALPEPLLESELFGHERGAFTDAKQSKKGLLEEAEGGTVFLDEVGEISANLQVKLLRFLEERVFRRVGGSAEIRTDVRVVAATNRDLRQAVDGGEFRQDLYYRLAVLHIRIPALRERAEDIELLAQHFVTRFAALFNSTARTLSAAAMERLTEYTWPGNVRELKNVIERAVLLSEHEAIGAADVLLEGDGPGSGGGEPRLLELPVNGLKMDELERELLVQALERTGGNKTRAAVLLGLTRDQIRHRIDKFGLGEIPVVSRE